MVAWRLRWRVLARRWHDFRDTIWFVPGLLTFGGVALFVLTTWVDRSGWLLPEAARRRRSSRKGFPQVHGGVRISHGFHCPAITNLSFRCA